MHSCPATLNLASPIALRTIRLRIARPITYGRVCRMMVELRLLPFGQYGFALRGLFHTAALQNNSKIGFWLGLNFCDPRKAVFGSV